MKNGLYYKEHFVCPDCKDMSILIFPLALIMIRWSLAKEAIAEFDLDVANHRADCVNARVEASL